MCWAVRYLFGWMDNTWSTLFGVFVIALSIVMISKLLEYLLEVIKDIDEYIADKGNKIDKKGNKKR